jgi:hypothetical protein
MSISFTVALLSSVEDRSLPHPGRLRAAALPVAPDDHRGAASVGPIATGEVDGGEEAARLAPA